jgi:chorismate mutase/prephenate dehydratase
MTDPIPMPVPERSIEALRREVDSIDDALHDLLMRRAEVVARIGALKTGPNGQAADGQGFLRPAREARVLRRLVGRHRGPLPKPVIIRMWRELMAALLRLQGPFALAVLADHKQVGLWDLARDHFGSLTPATAYDSSARVLRAVMEGQATVGVLPVPEPDEEDPWWRQLLSGDRVAPLVFGRLPFAPGAPVRGGTVEAFALGLAPQEETGRDRTLFAIEVSAETSRSSLGGALKAASLDPAGLYLWRNRGEPGRSLALLELEGFVPAADERLARFRHGRDGEPRKIWTLGGYAVPFAASELAATPA